ncbi:double-strand break repair helicase AddA [Pseudooceanicola sp. CBS1P-1]|uniref:DNA 3'-5' helicase n=1 Tax=Pseudooceanicola albus TaxID=2692189 RepID=A0A6L7FZN2_9RHOB|nr:MULTISPECIES: double-strand break repair helicase AddA [Pseudooceanicola]MBT9385726.1 double-strand break repair helicase AddA [Pseudooceanicola endophyticus]MXN16760.1 double-strand break repair helicase AddA [Pseudooceanicola albus]
MIPRNEASARQIRAARPDRSTWLAANAGSGKTRVLTDRVARLLLDGVSPQNILCLTYTKAAASEMQNRLFKRLGEWAMLKDDELRAALTDLGIEEEIDARRLSRARTLFASAIETPGGLKIQTIHSFCAGLLRRFPLEAGVSPQFQEIEDRNAVILREEVMERLSNGPIAETVERVASYLRDDSFAALVEDIARNRDLFTTRHSAEDLEAALELPPGMAIEDTIAMAFTEADLAFLPQLCEMLRAGTTAGDAKSLEAFTPIRSRDLDSLLVLEDRMLTKSGKTPFSPSKFPGAAAKKAFPHLVEGVEDWQVRIAEARALRVAIQARDKALVLQDFARAFLPAYAAAKEARGWLDFDDLILKTRDLLTDKTVSQWVLWRLDGGIDHILVDEAQDTSPVQWQVISALAREFTSGEGARDDVQRTIFVVGDKKQSIYSFQGADPSGFDRMRDDFGDRLEQTDTPLQKLELQFSFRSSAAILSLVDTVFEGREAAGFTPDQRHRAFKATMPGRVDLWPVVPELKEEEDREWFDPVDKLAENHHNVILSRRIARQIHEMIHGGATLPEEIGHTGTYRARPVRPKDFMILVRRRSGIFNEVIRACKELNLPMAGADRLKVAAELAVRDVTAFLAFLALPEDDLSLAAVLKSPIFGWDEQRLFDLAYRRAQGITLFHALEARPLDFEWELGLIRDMMGQSDFLRPYDLIERILTRHDGRRKLLGRLGPEAEDGLDALLDQALVYEQTEVPSLTGFLVWMEADELEIKRQMDAASDQIRVMTVHGSKGLESPIVILPETISGGRSTAPHVVDAAGLPLWSLTEAEEPAPMRLLRAARKEANAQELDRLLYVAMTRAEKWLIVAAAGKVGEKSENWYTRIRDGMQIMEADPLPVDEAEGLRLEVGDWDLPVEIPETRHVEEPVLPGWAHARAPKPPLPQKTLSPSEDLGGAKALPGAEGLDEAAAKRRGRQVHLLLEHLPLLAPADWPETAQKLLGSGPDLAEPAEIALLLGEATKVLTGPVTAPFFGQDALVETGITATLAELDGQRIHGIIDRLIIDENGVLAVDFKTNVTIPDRPEAVPTGLLRQMGAYAAALKQVYPDVPVRTALLWTRNATLMHLPDALVMAALHDAAAA